MFSGTKAILVAVFSIALLLGCSQKLAPLMPQVEVEPPKKVGLMDLPVLQLEEQQRKPRPKKLYTLVCSKCEYQERTSELFQREQGKHHRGPRRARQGHGGPDRRYPDAGP